MISKSCCLWLLSEARCSGVPSKRCIVATCPLQDALFASQEKFFQELFDSELASQATAEFEKAMKELAEEEPHLVEQFQKLSEAAGRVGSDATSQQEFTSCLKETLSGLAKNATDLQVRGKREGAPRGLLPDIPPAEPPKTDCWVSPTQQGCPCLVLLLQASLNSPLLPEGVVRTL